MTTATEKNLRQERALLWRARNLHRQFLGDGGWMPCGIFETQEDRWIFEPRIADDNQNVSMAEQEPSMNGTPSGGADSNTVPKIQSTAASVREAQHESEDTPQTAENDVEMTEIPAALGEQTANSDSQEQIQEFKSEEADATVKDLPPHPKATDALAREGNETGLTFGLAATAKSDDQQEEMDTSKDGEKADIETTNPEAAELHEDEHGDEQDAEMSEGSSPEPPRRMTTRAQASAVHPSGNQSPLSSVDTASTLPTPHPLFLIPDHIRPDVNFGLPAGEAEETRRLLWSYIQKQEETVRGFEHMLDSLLRACRMKADVLEWCKAEGHVGEMSDGEDWYDREKWGLAEGEDLKKGTDEDEVETIDETRTTAKRGRGRRA